MRLVENEAELAALAVVHELRGRGLSMQAVAEKMNEMGIATKKDGARWHTTQVFRLLKRA